MARFILHIIGSLASKLRKFMVIAIVFFAVIYLFIYFINKNRIDLARQYSLKNVSTYEVLKDPELNKTQEGKMILSAYRLTMCSLIGEACSDNKTDDAKNWNQSLIGQLTTFVAIPYVNAPASGTQWVYAGLSNAGFIPNTYAAQGIGHAALQPYAIIWKIFRDISYALLVLIVITLGFLIMFRANLGAQTVISIESALPKIVIAMILIAFSYPIAGFLIDFMYVVIGLAVSTLAPINPEVALGTKTAAELQNQYLNANLGMIWSAAFPDTQKNLFVELTNNQWFYPFINISRLGNSVMDFFPAYVNHIIRVLVGYAFVSGLLGFLNKTGQIDSISKWFNGVSFLGSGLGNLAGGVWGTVFGIILVVILFVPALIFGGGFFLGLLMILTIIFVMIRIFFMLLFGYIKLLLLVIFSPLILLFEAIPGQNAFGDWIKSLIGELIMFPAVIVLLMVGEAITSISTFNLPDIAVQNQNIWSPPFLTPVAGGGSSGETLSILVGVGLIFLIPDLVKQLKEWIGVKPFPVKVGLGTYFAGAAAITGATFGTAVQAGGLSQSLPGIRNYVGNLGWVPAPIKTLFGAQAPPGRTGGAASQSDGWSGG